LLWNGSQFYLYYFLFLFAYTSYMGLNVGGYRDEPDWPKMGPSIFDCDLSHPCDPDIEMARRVA